MCLLNRRWAQIGTVALQMLCGRTLIWSEGKGFEHVLILSGDHVYKMNYLQMLDYHKMQNADLTISAIRVRKEQAANSLGVLEVDQDLRSSALRKSQRSQRQFRMLLSMSLLQWASTSLKPMP